jgi:hypothetical protein
MTPADRALFEPHVLPRWRQRRLVQRDVLIREARRAFTDPRATYAAKHLHDALDGALTG